MRELTSAPVSSAVAVIGDYLNIKYARNTLDIDTGSNKTSNKIINIRKEPTGSLDVRIENDTSQAFIAVQAFRRYCTEFQVDYNDTKKELQAKGIYKDTKSTRLGTGWSTGTPVHCMVLDTSNSEFVDVENIREHAEEDEDRESDLSDKLDQL